MGTLRDPRPPPSVAFFLHLSRASCVLIGSGDDSLFSKRPREAPGGLRSRRREGKSTLEQHRGKTRTCPPGWRGTVLRSRGRETGRTSFGLGGTAPGLLPGLLPGPAGREPEARNVDVKKARPPGTSCPEGLARGDTKLLKDNLGAPVSRTTRPATSSRPPLLVIGIPELASPWCPDGETVWKVPT